jgi:hypothetical protein
MFHGGAGIGSEIGTVTYNGWVFDFSNQIEPVLPAKLTTIPTTPDLTPPDTVTGEVTQIYHEILGRDPDALGFSTYAQALTNGASVASVRQIVAQSPEAQDDLNRLYHQVFNRDIDPSGDRTYTNWLVNGGSLNAVEQDLAHSPESQSHLNLIYLQVLGRDADPVGIDTFTSALASGTSLDEVRGIISHSAEATGDLTRLFSGISGREPGTAELVGMEDQLATPGTSQPGVASNILTSGSAGGYALVTTDAGTAALTALPETPTLFTFDDVPFGNDTIGGFDPPRDTIQLSHTLAANFADLQTKMTNVGGSTLITFDSNRSIQINGIAPSSLGPGNFSLV